jgi:enoyl-CoA hydratase
MDADAACRHGFANHTVPAERLLPKAREIAAKMVAKSVLGLRMTKETINRNLSASLDQAIQLENRNQVLCLGSRPIVNPLKARH